MEFVVGQRWVSQGEPQLGLGIVVETDGRHITLHFPAIEEDRIYASHSAPLARISFQQGDTLQNVEQIAFEVKAVEVMNGLNYYLVTDSSGKEKIIPEPQLASTIQLSTPTERLFSGQFDKNRQFQLRAATLHYRYIAQESNARGLVGPRTNLLAHQIYIAHEVASRFAPRVLLADEVGLGKTIEAGLILHHQLQTGRSSRALIVVPEPLLHQWLVEMLRKFNLHFSLFDKERFNSLRESGEQNPFESEQLILCSQNFLCSDKNIATQASETNWDLVIVDEAHHLEWSPNPEIPSSDAYLAVEALAAKCQGLLLLTATPEQVGIESHFARLRLLDPSRFHNLQIFIEEQKQFVSLNEIVSHLNENIPLTKEQGIQLNELFDTPVDQSALTTDPVARQQLIKDLLDRHGTGRVLFRNTRAAIKNFPTRIPHSYPLQKPALYENCGLHPEEEHDDWITYDPRVEWLEKQLKTLIKEKVLLICASAKTAVDLEHHLHMNVGIRSTAFYEGLSIIERDRAAAYFSDEESGAQVMICSEIGSEGRNFQFAHHLILFDLPTNPDLLEQRIGRLDRIGQTEDVKIHIPYIKDSAQENIFRWYHEGINAFSSSFSAGRAVYLAFESQLEPWLRETIKPSEHDNFQTLIDDTIVYANNLREELKNGRDHLLELNSCNQNIAAEVIENIYESERSDALSAYMTMMFDTIGIEHEFHSEHSLVVRPTDQMLTADFPGLKEEGLTVTYNREKAQQREDMEFITWEHPLVTNGIEFIIGSELGKASIGAIQVKSLPAGSLLIECFYAIQCSAPKYLQVDRFLTATPIRVLLESSGKDLTSILKHTQLNKLRSHVKRSSRFAIIKQVKPELEKMIAKAQQIANEKAQPIIQEARQQMEESLNQEASRLRELKALNGSVRNNEIDFYTHQIEHANMHLDTSSAEMQAIRVIVNT